MIWDEKALFTDHGLVPVLYEGLGFPMAIIVGW